MAGFLFVVNQASAFIVNDCMLGTVAHGDGSAQVWEGFLYSRCTERMVCRGNVNVNTYRRAL